MTSERPAIVLRRLLLAKQFYLHAIDQSRATDSLNRLVAIHNFHIAVEILLKAILLEHGIRSDKTLNIDFEQMLSDIDNHPPFKAEQLRLPLRQELRNLNQQRNLAQHHVVEPHPTALDECRFFVHEVLTRCFQTYFGISFDAVNRVDFVEDERLRALLTRAQEGLARGDVDDSVCASSAAFEYAVPVLHELLPSEGFNSTFFFESRLRDRGLNLSPLIDAIRKTHERIRSSEVFAATVGSGISLARLSKFRNSVPHTTLASAGHPWFRAKHQGYTTEDAAYAVDFVIDAIIKWQSQGLDVAVGDWCLPGLTEYLARAWPRRAA